MCDGDFAEPIAARIQPPVVTQSKAPGEVLLPPGWSKATLNVPSPDPLLFSTLTGIVDYVRDQLTTDDAAGGNVVTVDDVTCVSVRGSLKTLDAGRDRDIFAISKARVPELPLGSWIELEGMIVRLRTAFADTPDRATLVSLLANITEEDIRISADDGISQQVTVRQGLRMELQTVPNPATLAPVRTFAEVAQPPSLFLVRLKKSQNGPLVQIIEADGGAWRIAAIGNVAAWLREKLPAGTRVLA